MTYEQYLLTCLAEECNEVAQRAIKAARFGLFETQPGHTQDNKFRLEEELGDLLGVMAMLGLVPDPQKMVGKSDRVNKYYAYSKKCWENNLT